MDKLPDYLIENYIIPFLSSYDLFYKLRSLGSYYYYCSRNKILTHFPGEMMITLKKIIDFNAKEDLAKNFEEITKKTFAEKRLLMLFIVHTNIALIIKKILETTRDQRVIELISFLYVITKNEEKYNLIEQRNYDEIQMLSGEEEGIIEMRKKMADVLEEDDLNFDLNEYITVYESLDREYLINDNNTGELYFLIGKLIEFCHTKIQFNEIKVKLEGFFKQITEASEVWPQRRQFYEKSIDLIADSQILSYGEKKMLELMKKYDIENELTDYNYEKEIIKSYEPNKFIIIKNNRKKLNIAILRIHQMYSFYEKCIVYVYKDNKNEKINEKIVFNVSGMILQPGEFLYTLSMIKKQFPINEQTFYITQDYLNHNIIHGIYNLEESNENKNKENKIKFCCCKCNNILENQKNKNNIFSTQIDAEHLEGGIHDLEKVLENTKLAGKEINESFQKFSENLNNLNNSLGGNHNS